MENINGTILTKDFFPEMNWVRDLIFFDGPLLSHFTTIYNENYLYYWADSDELCNRWLVFKVTAEDITKYLKGQKTLHSLILNKDKKFLYAVDIDRVLVYANIIMVTPENLPSDYLPDTESYYTNEIDIDLQELQSFSRKENSGILQAYFNDSPSVGYGEIEFNVFAPIMEDLNTIGQGIKKLYIKRQREFHTINQRAKKRKDRVAFDHSNYVANSTLTFIGNTSNSFGALLKTTTVDPKNEESENIQDEYVNFVIEFFESASKPEKFSHFVKDLDKSVIDSYKSLLEKVGDYRLQFNLNYENAISDFHASNKIPYQNVPQLIQNIQASEIDSSEDITLWGTFSALDLDNGSYRFRGITDNDEDYSSTGYLDQDRKEMAYKISWKKQYKVIITRSIKKSASSKRKSIRDVLISFNEEDKHNEI